MQHMFDKRGIASQRSARRRRLRLLRRVALLALAVCGAKVVVHRFGLELFSVNPLFTAMVASTFFLVSFLLSGVLTDYKESEKIPGLIASSLETLYLEIQGILMHHPGVTIDAEARALVGLGRTVHSWMIERVSTQEVYACYWNTHGQIVRASTYLSSSTLQGRLMGEMSALLSQVNRVQVIRETNFVPLVNWMADIAALFLCGGLVFQRSSSMVESVFFLFVLTFLLVFLKKLIDDIDNPFGWVDPNSAEDVSLDVLELALRRLEQALPQVHEAPFETMGSKP
jgi:hypothetical protein